jgi:hypothetical protein
MTMTTRKLAAVLLCAALTTAFSSSAFAQKENPDFKAVTEKLDSGGTFFMYVDIDGVFEKLISNLEPIFSAGPPGLSVVPAIARSVVKALGLDQLNDFGVSVVDLGNGMGRMKSYLKLKESVGLFEMGGGQPHEMAAIAMIPEDALIAVVEDTDLKPLLPLAEKVAVSAMGPAGEVKIREAIEKVKTQVKLDIPALLNSLDLEKAFYVRVDKTKMGNLPLGEKKVSVPTPRFVLMLKVNNSLIYDTAVERFQSIKAKMTPAEGKDGLKMQVFDAGDNPFGLKPVMGQGKDWFFFASDAAELEKAIATVADKKDVRTSPDFQKLAQGMPDKMNGMMYVSPRLGKEVMDIVGQISESADSADRKGLGTVQKLLGPLEKSAGRLTIRINDPQGVQCISQGDISAAQLVQGVAVAPVAIMAAIAVPNFLEAQVRSKVSRARADMRTIATGCEAYYVDNNVYPPFTENPAESVRGTVPDEKPVPSFKGGCLTTPVAYLTGFMPDPFCNKKGATYGYYAPKVDDKAGWILFGPGPDTKFDLDWKVYDPALLSDDQIKRLVPFTYDPTNGTVSVGDIWRIKQ